MFDALPWVNKFKLELENDYSPVPPYIGMVSNILLSTDLRVIRVPIVMFWVIIEAEVNQKSVLKF